MVLPCALICEPQHQLWVDVEPFQSIYCGWNLGKKVIIWQKTQPNAASLINLFVEGVVETKLKVAHMRKLNVFLMEPFEVGIVKLATEKRQKYDKA